MKKTFKHFISSFLIVAMLFSLGVPTFAANKDCELTVTETEDYRNVVTFDESNCYSVTYYFRTSQINIEVTDRTSGEIVAIYDSAEGQEKIMPYADTYAYSEETFTGYCYYITETYNSREYELTIPKDQYGQRAVAQYYFKAPYTTANSSYLNAFRNAVDQLDNSEKDFIYKAGMAVAADVFSAYAWYTGTGVITGAMVAALVEALKLTYEEKAAADNLAIDVNACRDAWTSAYNSCEGIFF